MRQERLKREAAKKEKADRAYQAKFEKAQAEFLAEDKPGAREVTQAEMEDYFAGHGTLDGMVPEIAGFSLFAGFLRPSGPAHPSVNEAEAPAPTPAPTEATKLIYP